MHSNNIKTSFYSGAQYCRHLLPDFIFVTEIGSCKQWHTTFLHKFPPCSCKRY